MSFNSEDFDVQPRRPILLSEELEKRWRSACAIVNNRRRRFRMVANLANHGEARKNKLERQEKLRDLFRAKRAALLLFDVAPSEYVTTYIPHDFQKAALDFTRSPDDVPSNEYNTQTRRFQEFVDDMVSIIKGHELKIMKRTNAVFSLRNTFHMIMMMTTTTTTTTTTTILKIIQLVHILKVVRIMSVCDGLFFAVKEVSLQDQGAQGKQSILQLEQEISLLSRFEHDNIVQYLGTDKVPLEGFSSLFIHKADPEWLNISSRPECGSQVVNLKNDGYGLTADIWSLGCTVLEMITHRPPYAHLEGMQALFRIGRGELPPVPNSLSRDARDFILKCLQVNPNDRPTAAQLMEHPFVKRPLQISSLWGEEQDSDASSGCLGDPNSQYEGNEQVPLDVLMQLLPVDNWTNLERFALDLATLLFILVCFEVNLHVDMVVVSFGSISIRNNSFRACVICSLFFKCGLE
ncbi:protein kinase domain-containing protein [Citrus sinensis]|uniref:Protein kinase domain-containing protein n=1 Tax=Citrus sinensis TaxID=2711 RepID=A0ACB8K758_CITSI|nr:protein kinase domain-containing protein [Citrus sinensis]